MSRPKRIPGYAYVGVQRYFLTICTCGRARHFTAPDRVALVVHAFVQTATEYSMTIVAWCVMPDHMHLLLDGDHDGADMAMFVRVAKQRSGFRFKQRHHAPLWQEGYFEHVLRDEERTEDVVFYIIANPLRKGLVEHVMAYPHWGSMRFTREELLKSVGIRRS